MFSMENSACTLKIYSGSSESRTCLRSNIYIIHIDFYIMLKNHLLYNNFRMRNRRNGRKLIKEKIHLNLI